MIDTIRVLVSWACNRHCSYCCNEKPEIRRQFRLVRLQDIDFSPYQTVCISGGEPLLNLERVKDICDRLDYGQFAVLYTNGDMLTRTTGRLLRSWGIAALNIGLHGPADFQKIPTVCFDMGGLGFSLRFHAQDIYEDTLRAKYGCCTAVDDNFFRFWKMDDCDRPNEDRVILVPGRYDDD